MAATAPSDHDIITVGRLVEVASRTWPGINKPGGVARVVDVHYDAANKNDNDDTRDDTTPQQPTHVNVQYILGSSREKRVPIEYVKLAPQYEDHAATTFVADAATTTTTSDAPKPAPPVFKKSLRDRSMLLGRCRRCGSLRKDCGSCDWATEEEEARSAADDLAATSKPIQKSGLRKLSSLEEDGESSEEEDDMAEIQQLIRKSQHRRRKARKDAEENLSKRKENKRKKNRRRVQAQQSSLLTSTTPKGGTVQKQILKDKRYCLSSSSSDDDNNDNTPISKRRLKMGYQKYSRMGRLSVLDLDLSSSSSSSDESVGLSKRKVARRKKTMGHSILESLPSVSNAAIKKKKNRSPTTNDEAPLDRDAGPSHPVAGSDEDSISSESIGEPQHRGKKASRKKQQPATTLGGSSSSEESGIIQHETISHEEATIDQQLLALEERSRREMEIIQRQQQQSSHLIGDDFIQPEGEDAVENLPEDIVDLSKSLPYKELARFFDSMATKMEDELLPDFRLRLAHLQRQVRALDNPPRSLLGTENRRPDLRVDPSANASKWLHKCYDAWAEAEARLIRNGMDQCRAALRRLMNDNLYRKNKKSLTAAQRKRCRGNGIVDARNLRMDSIEEAVESIVRDLKIIADACELEIQRQTNEMEGPQEDASSSDDMTMMSSEDEDPLDSQPLSSLAKENNSNDFGDESTSRLPPFHRHQHSKRVRSESSTKRSAAKRPRSTSKRKTASKKKPKNRTAAMRDGSDIVDRSLGNVHENLTSINVTSTTRNRALASSVIAEQDFSGTDGNSDSSCDHGSSAHDIVQAVASETSKNESTGILSQKRQRSSLQNQVGLERSVGRLHVPKDRVQSISQRMQAFLDANAGNGTINASDGDNSDYGREQQPASRRRQRRVTATTFTDATRPKHTVSGTRHQQIATGAESNVDGNRDSVQPEDLKVAELYERFRTRASGVNQPSGAVDTGMYVQDTEDILEGDASSMPVTPMDSLHQTEPGTSEDAINADDCLATAHTYLMSSEGSRTLQEFIATNDPNLHDHLRILSSCCSSLKSVWNGDHDLPPPLCRNSRSIFLDFLVAQLLDALYSAFFPSAWAIGDKVNRSQVLRELISLRDAIGGCIPIVESVARCLTQRFECQQWRVGSNNNLFVASVDPEKWKEFLQNGTHPTALEGTRTRLAALGDVWPRIETNSLCHILAFAGGGICSNEEPTPFRWQILSKLFSAGILAPLKNNALLRLPSSPDHLSACREEMDCFSALLGSGNMNPLPKADSMMVNLIQRTLTFQAMTYELDETSRRACYPQTASEGEERRHAALFWRLTQPLYLASSPVVSRRASIADISSMGFSEGEADDKSYRNILRPSSQILCSCLALVAKWGEKVSQKKARRMRFEKAVHAMSNQLMNESKGSHDARKGREPLTFEATFETKAASQEIGNGDERSIHFLKEAAAYVRIVLASFQCSDPQSIGSDLASTVWKMVADENLQRRQSSLLGSQGDRKSYSGDAFVLFCNAKIAATTLCLMMNVSPWHLGLGKSITRLPGVAPRQTKESFSYAFSCIFACLDCLSDITAGPKIFAELYKIIVLLFQTLTATIRLGEKSEAREHLKSTCFSDLFPILERSLKFHLSVESMPKDSTHIRLCLAAVRSIQAFLVTEISDTCPSETIPSHDNAVQPDRMPIDQQDRDDDDDNAMWGGMDDSIFASMELDLLTTSSNNQTKKTRGDDLAQYLSKAFECSKPSTRFAINGNLTENIQMSSFGKHLISNEVGPVFDCLAMTLATATDKESFLEISRIVSRWIQPRYNDNEDAEFYSKASRRLSIELCALARSYGHCHDFVVGSAQDLLLTILSSLLDSSRLETFPSCNLDMIRTKDGRAGIDRALALLDLLNDDSLQQGTDPSHSARLRLLQRKRKEKAEEIWKLCSNFGSSLCKDSQVNLTMLPKSIGTILLHLDSDIQQDNNPLNTLVSLESEFFKVFRLLRNVVSTGARHQDSEAGFVEKIASASIMLLSDQILRIVRSLKYLDQTLSGSQDFEQNFKVTALANLLKCFLEVLVAFVAWGIREIGGRNSSSGWSHFRRRLLDKLLLPALKRQPFDLTCVLQELSLSAKHIGGSNPTPDFNAPGIPGCGKYFDSDLYFCILRRSQQLLMAAAVHGDMSKLQGVMVQALLDSREDEEDQVSQMVGSGFPLSTLPPTLFARPRESPLQKDIDEYLNSVEASLASNMDSGSQKTVATSKKSFLSTYLLPSISHRGSDSGQKRKLLKLLGNFLGYNATAAVRLGTEAPDDDLVGWMDIDIAHKLIKGLTTCAFQCIGQQEVDEDFVRSIFVCAKNLATTSLIVDETHWILWSRERVDEAFGKSIKELSKCEIDGAYIWIFFQWLYSIAKTFVDTGAGVTDDIARLRSRCREAMKQRCDGIDEEPLNLNDDSKSVELWEELLMGFEGWIFPSRLEVAPNFVNTYAKDRQDGGSSQEGSLVSWMPSRATQRSAKDLMAVVVARS